jgi:glutamate-1-semialdehyde aminotransferase
MVTRDYGDADLAVFGKAVANGYPMAAAGGNGD